MSLENKVRKMVAKKKKEKRREREREREREFRAAQNARNALFVCLL